MSDINNVTMTGRLTKEPEMTTSEKSGKRMVSFTLACNRQPYNGETKADFIRCIAWEKMAEAIYTYTHKASRVAVEGRIQTGSYTDRQGHKVYTTDILCSQVVFLDSKQQAQQYQPAEQHGYVPVAVASQIPQQVDTAPDPQQPGYGSPSDYPPTINISSDDLPF